MTAAIERPSASGSHIGGGTGGATGTTVTVLGLVAATAAVEHGLGEIRQGPVRPPAVVFESWPHVAAFDLLNGEPAMSLIPNLLVSGVLSVLVALILGAVALSPSRAHAGSLLIALSVALLLVGGGFGPPLLGLLAGLLAVRIDAPPARWQGPATRLGARSWPWLLLVAVGCFLGLVPGTALLYLATGETAPTLTAVLTVAAFPATALAMWAARARDRVAGGGESRRPSGGATERWRLFRAWAGLWSILLVTLFVSVTALTLAVWAAGPHDAETSPVTDLGFFALGMVIATGFLSQLRADPLVVGFHQGVLATVALAAAGLLGRRIEPLVGAVLILAAFAVLAALHPAPRTLLRVQRSSDGTLSITQAALTIIAIVPAVSQAAQLLEAAVAAGPSCFLGRCAQGDRLAELAAALVTAFLVGLLAVPRPPGARLPVWAAGAAALLIGTASLALPDATGSLGITGGGLAAGWGGLFIVVGELERPRRRSGPPRRGPEPIAPHRTTPPGKELR